MKLDFQLLGQYAATATQHPGCARRCRAAIKKSIHPFNDNK
jgi:hypothetical protein